MNEQICLLPLYQMGSQTKEVVVIVAVAEEEEEEVLVRVTEEERELKESGCVHPRLEQKEMN